jgi:hypothetical protein
MSHTDPVAYPNDLRDAAAIDAETSEDDDAALYELPPIIVFPEIDPGYYHESSGKSRKRN